MKNMQGPHFVITKDKTKYFHLSIIFIIAVFAAAMTSISLITFGDSLDLLSVEFIPSKKTSLALNTSKTELRPGIIFPVDVFLKTGLHVSGVDIVVEYDPSYLKLVELNPRSSEKAAKYLNTPTSVFSIFPYIDFKQNGASSKIFFTALSKPLKEFKGKGLVASLNFQALRSGNTTVKLVFKPNDPTDTNVAYKGKDVLTSVNDLNLEIK